MFCQICQFRPMCRESDYPIFTSFYFVTNILQRRVTSLAFSRQPGGPGPCIYVPQWLCAPSYTPRYWAPFRRDLRLAGPRRRYSNLPPHGKSQSFTNPQFFFVRYFVDVKSGDSAVGIATAYGLDDRGIGVRVSVGSRIFTTPSTPGSGAHQASYPLGRGGGKTAGAWMWPLTSN
jgi:hypothetical protein